jgi:multidrug transporter EmrE-like cation transporter
VAAVSHETFATLCVYLMLALAGFAGAAGDTLLNHWAISGAMRSLVLSTLLWFVAVGCFGGVLKFQAFPFGPAVVLGLLVHAGMAVVLDRWCFGGRLTPMQWAGLGCAVAAILLIDRGNPAHRADAPRTPAAEVAKP